MQVRWRLSLAAVAGFAVVILWAVASRPSRPSSAPWTLEVDMRVSDGRFAEVFWSADVWSTDVSFTPERSVRLPLHVGGTELQRLRFPFPPRDVRWLRFDPTDAAGEIVVGDIVVREPTGRAHRLPPDSLEPANQIASVDRQDGVTRFIATPGAGDPYLLLPVGCLTAASADRRERLSSFGVIALCLAAPGHVRARRRLRSGRGPRCVRATSPCRIFGRTRSVPAGCAAVDGRALYRRVLIQAAADAGVSDDGAVIGSMGR